MDSRERARIDEEKASRRNMTADDREAELMTERTILGPTWHDIVILACAAVGVNPRLVFEMRKLKIVCEARRLAWAVTREIGGYSYPYFAHVWGVDHSSVCDAVKLVRQSAIDSLIARIRADVDAAAVAAVIAAAAEAATVARIAASAEATASEARPLVSARAALVPPAVDPRQLVLLATGT